MSCSAGRRVCIWVTAALVGVYTFAGGLKAVVYTDVIQCVVMIGGCLLVLILGLTDLGGWGGMMEKIAALGERTANHADLIVPADRDSPFVWPAILFGLALVLSPAYWIGNQAIVQRSLGAKSQFQAQAAYVWGALLKTLIPVIIAVPGLIALAKFPELADGDQAFPKLVAAVLPAGIRGLFLAAFVAALMSSVDSYLNASATVVTHDFYRRYGNRGADDRRLLVIGRSVTVVLMIWAVGFAFLVKWMDESGKASGIYAIFQTLMAFFQGPALAVILCGFLWKRANGIGALTGFLCGIAMSVSLFAIDRWHEVFGLEPLFQVPEPFLYFSVWAFLTALAIIVLVEPGDKAGTGREDSLFERRKRMTFLHRIGDLVREWMIAVPMPLVRGLFLLLLLALLVWVWRLPEEMVRAPREETGPARSGANLKLWASVALGLQILIYLIF